MRVATFNILHGRSPSDDRVDVERFAEAVRALDADVLALQEVDRNQPRSGHADLTAVAAEAMGAADSLFVAALAGTPGSTWVAATGEEQPDAAAYGIALLSRHPVTAWQIVRLGRPPVRVPMWFPGSRRPELVGDLNMGPSKAGSISGLRALVTEATFPAPAPREQIDHILARGVVGEATSGGAHQLPLSDHRALFVDLA